MREIHFCLHQYFCNNGPSSNEQRTPSSLVLSSDQMTRHTLMSKSCIKEKTYFNLHSFRGHAKSQDKKCNGGDCGLHGGSWQQFCLAACLSLVVLSSCSALRVCLPSFPRPSFKHLSPAAQHHVIRTATNESKVFFSRVNEYWCIFTRL